MTEHEHMPPTHSRRELWLDLAGCRLFALTLGAGDPVVFLHGGLADHRAALTRLESLGETNALLCPDLRGSGRSIYAGPLSWDRLADDVAAWLDLVGVERAIVGGTSMGSAVAIRFALRHPRRLRGLILMSPLFPGGDLPLADDVSVALRTMAEFGERASERGIDELRPLFAGLPEPARGVALERLSGFDAKSFASTTRFLATLEQPLASARELASVEVPVLLVPGSDPQHPAEVAALYGRHLLRPTLVDPTDPRLSEHLTRFCLGVGRGS